MWYYSALNSTFFSVFENATLEPITKRLVVVVSPIAFLRQFL